MGISNICLEDSALQKKHAQTMTSLLEMSSLRRCLEIPLWFYNAGFGGVLLRYASPSGEYRTVMPVIK